MKRFIVSLSLMLTVGLTTIFASDETNVSEKVKASFKKEFPGAESVKWNNLGDYQMATFVLEGHGVEAFFNNEGKLEGAARYIQLSQLPMAVTRSLNKRFPGAEYMVVLEVSNTEGTSYRITVEVSNKRYRVKTDAAGIIVQINRK